MDKIINKNIDKIKEKSVKNFTNNYTFTNDNDEDDKYISYINENMDGVDIADLYDQQYKFDNDESILDSFQKIYEKQDIKYELRNTILNLLGLDTF